jgi:hypoxanthine phosphoribosyltransferase
MQRTREELADILGRSELLYTREQVDAAFDAMAAEISNALAPTLGGHDLLLMPVLKGGIYPAVQLMSRLALPFAVDYLHATRYRGTTEGGELAWRSEPHARLEDRLIMIVDDIFDQGRTLEAIVEYCHDAGAAAVMTAAFVMKRHDDYLTDYRPDYIGLEVDDRYVFGCGMDFEEYFRGLPEIRALVD